jgi:hypothetical protein
LADRKKVPAAFYRTEMGMEPVREWLRFLPPEDRKIVGDDLQTIDHRVRLARRHAGLPLARRRSLGAAQHNPAWYRPDYLRRARRAAGAVERLYEENAEDPGKRTGAGAQ